jgi:putative FmdB family regulatory protein
MPTYQYRCNKCAHNFEIEQRISAEPLKECPACKTTSLKRVIGDVGLAFNTSGFYITDSRKKSEKTNTTKTPHKK